MMTPSSLHRPPSTPSLRHHPPGTPLHPPATPLLALHQTPLAQFPSTPRQQTYAAGVRSSPRPSSQWASQQTVTPAASSSQHKTSAEWAAMAQQWASQRQPTTPRQSPTVRQSPYHAAGGDATPLIDET